MSLDRKISQIKKLSELTPDKDWENKTKHEILAEISGQNRLRQAEKLTSNERFDLSMMNFFNHLVPSLSKVIAGFLIIFMGTGVSFVAQASVPGEPLWPIKRSIEKVQLSFTISSVKETEVHMKHASERLEEIDKIISDSNENPVEIEDKQAAIKKAVTHLEQDITAVDAALKVVQQEKEPLEIVELAKKVTDATKEAVDILEQQAIDVDDEELSEVLDSVKEVNAEVKKSAVNIALEVHQDIMAVDGPVEPVITDNSDLDIDTSTPDTIGVVEETTTVVDQEELEAVTNVIKEILASELDEVLEEVQDLNEKVGATDQEEISKLQEENTEAVVDEASIEEEISLGDIDSIKGNPEEGDNVLEEARALLADGFLKNAFYKISLVKEKYARADVIMEQIQEAIDNNNLIDANIIDQVDIEVLPEVIDETNTEEVDTEASFTDEAIAEEEPAIEEDLIE
jgi:hypothetical protein